MDDPLSNQNFLSPVSVFGSDFGNEVLFSLDNFSVFAVSEELKVDFGLESGEVYLGLAHAGYGFGLLVSHDILFHLKILQIEFIAYH